MGLEGLCHWVWSPLQFRDRPSLTTVLCSSHAKLSFPLIQASLSNLTRTPTASVSYRCLSICFRHTPSLTTPDPGRRPRVVYADTPRSHCERGCEARLYILLERPHRASTRFIRAWKGGLPPTERRTQPRPRAPRRERMCVLLSRCDAAGHPKTNTRVPKSWFGTASIRT